MKKATLLFPREFPYNECPHCGAQFVVIYFFDADEGDRWMSQDATYCYQCGRPIKEKVCPTCEENKMSIFWFNRGLDDAVEGVPYNGEIAKYHPGYHEDCQGTGKEIPDGTV